MTETIYGKQIRPVIVEGADAMDQIFPPDARMLGYSVRYSGTRKAIHLPGGWPLSWSGWPDLNGGLFVPNQAVTLTTSLLDNLDTGQRGCPGSDYLI